MEQIGKITRIVNDAVIYDGLTVDDADKIEVLLKELEASINYMKCCKGLPNTLHAQLISLGKHKDYNPIPLTEEWLLKFGFEFKVDYLLRKKGFTICFEKSGNTLECYLESVGVDIIYVHQLQNLYFALTNEELMVAGCDIKTKHKYGNK